MLFFVRLKQTKYFKDAQYILYLVSEISSVVEVKITRVVLHVNNKPTKELMPTKQCVANVRRLTALTWLSASKASIYVAIFSG